MKKHKVRETPVCIGAVLDTDMQKIFNCLRKHYGISSNSAIVRFLAKQAYDTIRREQVPQS